MKVMKGFFLIDPQFGNACGSNAGDEVCKHMEYFNQIYKTKGNTYTVSEK